MLGRRGGGRARGPQRKAAACAGAQSDRFAENPSVAVLAVTSHRVEAAVLRADVVPECRVEGPSYSEIDMPQLPHREQSGSAK
jgi:hypothetical protein